MRIAQIAPVWFPVPPKGYGGIEIVVSLLAEGLMERGHEVTLFASGGSATRADHFAPLDEAPDPSLLGDVWIDTFHTLSSYMKIAEDGGYDVIHDHSGIVGPAMAAVRGSGPPVVHTLHGPWTTSGIRFYDLIHRHIHLVAISETQRDDNPGVDYAATVYNGIDLSTYSYSENKEDFLVFIGRANPDKGPTRAIEVAQRTGLPLKMIIKRNEPRERQYWDEVVSPMLDSSIEVLEHVSHNVKVDLLSRARAMIFPIQWMEPFGLVMVEAMACGTPVVAGRWGAAIEVVADGETGFLGDTIGDLVECVGKLDAIKPAACRERVASMFSAETMIEGYEKVFEQVVR